MGADARSFVFEYVLYRESIMPAFMRFMCEGVKEPWLQDLQSGKMRQIGIPPWDEEYRTVISISPNGTQSFTLASWS
jgi:hypothetical protein